MGTPLRIDRRSTQDGECCGRIGEFHGDPYERFVSHAMHCGTKTNGFHNQNFLMPLLHDLAEQLGHHPNSPVKVRVPIPDALKVVARTWRHESHLLRALQGRVPNVPALLKQSRRSSLHVYVEGVTLSALCPPGKPVDTLYVTALADLFGTLNDVRRQDLPPLPMRWPKDGDSRGYLRCLARLTDGRVRRPNWSRFGSLFTSLGVPRDAMRIYSAGIPELQSRPYALLHTDLHRDNLVVTGDAARPLFFLDWELASYGDPLHDLATHLVRMRYPEDQWAEVIEAWRSAVSAVRPEAVAGLDVDLPLYLGFERAQSVYPDVMRAAAGLLREPNVRDLDLAAAEVRRALRRAREPLGLQLVDDLAAIRDALLDWCGR